MVRIIAITLFGLSLSWAAQGMPLAPVHQSDGSTRQKCRASRLRRRKENNATPRNRTEDLNVKVCGARRSRKRGRHEDGRSRRHDANGQALTASLTDPSS